jgi:hypothetical protein
VVKLVKALVSKTGDYASSNLATDTNAPVVKLGKALALEARDFAGSKPVRGTMEDAALWAQTSLENLGEVTLRVSIYSVFRTWRVD